ncbi:hypothetical protein E4633_03720 [Geomonas terrae]|uniref:Integrase catalytic domain-containing protein n=1 Tax=Geomonas terrae TaxID=2562681 RepID=A0A4S1CLX5_9BACT|nr:hypothetical protein E4633_03720 [Geomonas terrae]
MICRCRERRDGRRILFEINDIVSAAPDTSTFVEGFARVVGIGPAGDIYLIRLDIFPLTAPFPVPSSEFRAAIEAGEILLGQEVELELVPTTQQLTPVEEMKKEKAVSIIAPLFETDEALFDSELRGKLFQKRAKECNVSPRMVRRLFYLYLWGGKSDRALVPRYFKSGGLGLQQAAGSKRRGRKANDKTTASQVPLPAVREQLEKGAKMFFLQGARTLEEAFMETKKMYYKKGTLIESKGKIKENLLPPEKLPSLGQFRYVCEQLKKELGIKVRKVARRIRQKRPNWDFRGWSRDQVPGPGFRFEIDATKVQVRLVSRFNRAKVLKEATLYIIIDVWSGAIVGYALSLHNASWALASQALHNCFTDKQAVFDRLGLNYTSDDWPCHHLPSRLAADRGEFVSDKAGLVPGIGIVVEIMPPMCPERKGKVESAIKDVKHGHSHRLPGRHPKVRMRRENDGTDSAALTIYELEQIIVEIIIGLNHDPVPSDYIPPEMIEDGEEDVTHIGLYRWGLQHYCGHTRKLADTEIYENLMMKGVASLTPRGLYFKSQTFVSPTVVNAVTYKRASGKNGLLVDIRYDEHRADRIWFFDRKAKKWVQALNKDEAVIRRKAAFFELEIFRNEVKRLRRDAKDESLHRKSERDKGIRQIVKQAEEEAREDRRGVSKATRRKDMRGSTELEIEAAKAPTPLLMMPVPPVMPATPVQIGSELQEICQGNDLTPAAEGMSPPIAPLPDQQHPPPEVNKSDLTIGELAMQMWRSRR